MGVSRRTVIVGSGLLGALAGLGGWALLADLRLVPGRSVIDGALGRCDVDGAGPAEATPGRLVRSSFFSQHRNRSVNYLLNYPPKVAAGAKLPVCLVLHGLGRDERATVDELGYDRLLAAAVGSGVPPFVLASVEGGDGYWHPRQGDDPLGMLLEDFPLILRQHGLRTETFALLGWSMGGFGALLAATEAPERFVAVVANGPAIWPSYEQARAVNETAFASAEDWQRYGDLTDRIAKLPTQGKVPMKVRIDCGKSDSFAPAVEELRDRLPDPTVVRLAPGCHDSAFWRSVAGEQLALIGAALSPPKPKP